jgi:hypothetical protein
MLNGWRLVRNLKWIARLDYSNYTKWSEALLREIQVFQQVQLCHLQYWFIVASIKFENTSSLSTNAHHTAIQTSPKKETVWVPGQIADWSWTKTKEVEGVQQFCSLWKPTNFNHVLFQCVLANFIWYCIKESLGWECGIGCHLTLRSFTSLAAFVRQLLQL